MDICGSNSYSCHDVSVIMLAMGVAAVALDVKIVAAVAVEVTIVAAATW